MKWSFLAAGLLLVAGPAMAQTTTVRTKTTITHGEQVRIHKWVVSRHVQPIPPPAGVTIARGAVLPPAVVLHSFPPKAPYARYRYTVIGKRTVLVNPATHRVIQVIR